LYRDDRRIKNQIGCLPAKIEYARLKRINRTPDIRSDMKQAAVRPILWTLSSSSIWNFHLVAPEPRDDSNTHHGQNLTGVGAKVMHLSEGIEKDLRFPRLSL
jgi:hypothetical protein